MKRFRDKKKKGIVCNKDTTRTAHGNINAPTFGNVLEFLPNINTAY